MNVNARILGTETKQEDAMIGDRERENNGSSPRPPMHNVIKASWRREVQQSIDARSCQQLAQSQEQRSRAQPDLHMQRITEEEVKERDFIGRSNRSAR